MERLTIRNSNGTVSQPTSTTIEDVFYRLAAYEDTGLAPEDIKELCTDEVAEVARTFRRMIQSGEIAHLQELLNAERGGRLVVLPCKVGDTVYVINRNLNRVFECTVISIRVGHSTDLKNYIKTKWVGANGNESIRKWTFRQIGRYVFLTRADAERTLEGGEDNG